MRDTTADKIFRDLYDSEINFSISCFWDAGFTCKIGDEMNGYKASQDCVSSVDECATVLCRMACSHYPNSWFSAKWGDKDFIV